MKVYGLPDEVPFAEPDYKNYDPAKEEARENAHSEALKKWLISAGYTGKHTGEIFSEPMADGYANYMFADGKTSALIHLPYGDAWDNRNVQHLPKKEVLRRIAARKGLDSIFSKKESAR